MSKLGWGLSLLSSMFHPVLAPWRVSESRPFAWRHVKRVVGVHLLLVACPACPGGLR